MREKLIKLIGEFCGGLSVADITPPYGYENLAEYLLAHGATVQEWVSVEDALPENGTYLVRCKYMGVSFTDILSFARDCGALNELERICMRDAKDFWYGDDAEYGLYTSDAVTHWMKLPALPKEE